MKENHVSQNHDEQKQLLLPFVVIHRDFLECMFILSIIDKLIKYQSLHGMSSQHNFDKMHTMWDAFYHTNVVKVEFMVIITS